MRIFNLHDDIGEGIRLQKEQNQELNFRESHISRLKKGGIYYSSAACWFRGSESWEDMEAEITLTKQEIEEKSKLILKGDNLSETCRQPQFLLAVEGMCGIDSHVKKRIRWMYEQGVRLASFTWNEFNTLATGVGGDPGRGLTKKGRKAVRIMNELKMIIDVSHANEHTFWDIINETERPVIASHSNSRSLCIHERNLTDEQIIAIAEKGGLIGLNSYGPFISEQKKNRNGEGLAKHARYITSIVGHEHVACGFDFMDYLGEEDSTADITKAEEAQNFLKALQEEHFSEEEIKDIAYRNAFRFLKENL